MSRPWTNLSDSEKADVLARICEAENTTFSNHDIIVVFSIYGTGLLKVDYKKESVNKRGGFTLPFVEIAQAQGNIILARINQELGE